MFEYVKVAEFVAMKISDRGGSGLSHQLGHSKIGFLYKGYLKFPIFTDSFNNNKTNVISTF